ncbi:hypothetical protein ALC57_03449 [Trachymyrmex cornetzi]|uniref:Uncharacterized protein n=1 Tax=Trachymyrmex cornetzi TaxID=471704 RepID=A0A195EG14_9HYME|nr:hypothetical protein ALC57_03449 [Trachymyrmex cornetzi]
MPRASEGLEEHAMEIRETIAETQKHSNYRNDVMLLQNCWNIAINTAVTLQQHRMLEQYCRDVAAILLQILCCMGCENVYAYFALDFKVFRASKTSKMSNTNHGGIIYKENFLFASKTFGYKSRNTHTFFAHPLSSSSGQQQP